MSMLPKDLEEILGTEEEFKEANPFQDEEHNELLDEKLIAEYQENLRDEEIEDDDEMTLGSMDRF